MEIDDILNEIILFMCPFKTYELSLVSRRLNQRVLEANKSEPFRNISLKDFHSYHTYIDIGTHSWSWILDYIPFVGQKFEFYLRILIKYGYNHPSPKFILAIKCKLASLIQRCASTTWNKKCTPLEYYEELYENRIKMCELHRNTLPSDCDTMTAYTRELEMYRDNILEFGSDAVIAQWFDYAVMLWEEQINITIMGMNSYAISLMLGDIGDKSFYKIAKKVGDEVLLKEIESIRNHRNISVF